MFKRARVSISAEVSPTTADTVRSSRHTSKIALVVYRTIRPFKRFFFRVCPTAARARKMSRIYVSKTRPQTVTSPLGGGRTLTQLML